MKNLLIGSHYFLNAYPLYVYPLIFLFGYLILLGGRKLFEGRAYNVSFSASWGCACLTGFLIIAAWIIQQPDCHPVNWMESKYFHFIVMIVSIIFTIVNILSTRPKQIMDKWWFAMFVFPLFIYFVLTTVPIYLYGSLIQKIAGCDLLLLWLLLVRYDSKKERLDQRRWIRRHHPEWKFKN